MFIITNLQTLQSIYFIISIALFGGTFIYLSGKLVSSFLSNIRWRMRSGERLNERLDMLELANAKLGRKLTAIQKKISKK